MTVLGCGRAQAPPQLRRNIAVYEAARALLGYITPDFDEISKVPPPCGSPNKSQLVQQGPVVEVCEGECLALWCVQCTLAAPQDEALDLARRFSRPQAAAGLHLRLWCFAGGGVRGRTA